uniref:Uncharacterized protein n=1 Tax=Nelumbo nucifera TaxID=4432 RepID=A0A822ZCS8_NELNU|nr:TPA_asm: hypothetical protein HUJ06_015804 [Nelumbo nucifera]
MKRKNVDNYDVFYCSQVLLDDLFFFSNS